MNKYQLESLHAQLLGEIRSATEPDDHYGASFAVLDQIKPTLDADSLRVIGELEHLPPDFYRDRNRIEAVSPGATSTCITHAMLNRRRASLSRA